MRTLLPVMQSLHDAATPSGHFFNPLTAHDSQRDQSRRLKSGKERTRNLWSFIIQQIVLRNSAAAAVTGNKTEQRKEKSSISAIIVKTNVKTQTAVFKSLLMESPCSDSVLPEG